VSGVRIKIKMEVQRKRMWLLREVEDVIKEVEEEEGTVREPAGVEDNSTDEESERKKDHGYQLLPTEHETLTYKEDTSDMEKVTNKE